MPFRTQPRINSPEIQRTFDNVRLAMEPTLYAKHFLTRHDPDSDLYPGMFEQEWQYIPIPFYFDPETEEIKKAWTVGSLDIRHVVQHTNQEISAIVRAGAYGSEPDDLSTVVIAPAAGAELRLFDDYLTDVDLTGYDAIGVGTISAVIAAYPYTISTTLLWRPRLL